MTNEEIPLKIIFVMQLKMILGGFFMRAISHGNIYDIYDVSLKTYDKLPALHIMKKMVKIWMLLRLQKKQR